MGMRARSVDLILGSSVGRWRIDKLLGEGGFGVVYQVSDSTGPYALKIEAKEGRSDSVQVLKMETSVLTAVTEHDDSRHFCLVKDYGSTKQLNYLVMSLAGKSLRDILYSLPGRRFTMGTALGAGIQAIEAIETLHACGYIHRDIKPGNFLVGRAEQNALRNLFLVDFGLCRKFAISNTRVLRPARRSALFRGTMRYASIAAHRNMDLSRKDDLESWIYMVVEIITGALPWKFITDNDSVCECKKSCRLEPTKRNFLEGCPFELRTILSTIDTLKFYDVPPYRQLTRLMRRALHSTNSQEFPYDWEKAGGGIF